MSDKKAPAITGRKRADLKLSEARGPPPSYDQVTALGGSRTGHYMEHSKRHAMQYPFEVHNAEEILHEIDQYVSFPPDKPGFIHDVCREKPKEPGDSSYSTEWFYFVQITSGGCVCLCTVPDDIAETQWYQDLVVRHPFFDDKLKRFFFDDMLDDGDVDYRPVIKAAAEFVATYLQHYRTHVADRQSQSA